MDTQLMIRYMEVKDIDEVYHIERSSFTTPWKKESFYHELYHNQYAHYLVIEKDNRVIGYCGIWIIIDNAQITNIAILKEYRGKYYGEELLKTAIRVCKQKGAKQLSLEVRVTNYPAQGLYRKLGFLPGGIRKNYYTDNGEDAYVMWVKLNGE